MDRDNMLNRKEFQHMVEILLFISKENRSVSNGEQKNGANQRISYDHGSSIDGSQAKILNELRQKIGENGNLSQEDFLVWCVENNIIIAPLLELLFQVCHVALGLKPNCRHHEHEIGRLFQVFNYCIVMHSFFEVNNIDRV